MRKHYLLFLLVGVLILSGCEKAFLKRSTISIEARRAEIIVDFPNDEGKYLDDDTKERLLELYVEEIEDRMDRGKITVLGPDEGTPDYVLTIQKVHMVEMVVNEYEDGEYFDLSEINIRTEMDLIRFKEDVPTFLTSEEEVSEYITSKKDKKGDDGDPYVQGFGGRDGAFKAAAQELRSTVKKSMKNKQ